jgi:hypothetical protein
MDVLACAVRFSFTGVTGAAGADEAAGDAVTAYVSVQG